MKGHEGHKGFTFIIHEPGRIAFLYSHIFHIWFLRRHSLL